MVISILKPNKFIRSKIINITQKPRKKDFFNLYQHCLYARLEDLIFKNLDIRSDNIVHVLKSLTYFADAEKDPMPKINFPVTWQQIKSYFRREVPILTRKLLDL